ncbi:hypothetical protein D3C87_2018480 [compost metagenome]
METPASMTSWKAEATTVALGWPWATSLARLGPESTPILRQQVSSRKSWLIRLKLPGSSPLTPWIRIREPSR